jgi:ribonuclease D
MEWPWNDWKRNDLQNKIGLIQIASGSKIALFHIGLHPGKTTQDIISPTLRRLLEDPAIGKVGVNVLKADFSRLSRFFGLKPKGAIESSHLYRLVKHGQRKPELVSVKLVSLAHQVEDQLGLPLYKGDVRTSNWSKPLSKDQINYAAGDAYAGCKRL